jgi:mannosyltransferase OCH1-like enzyme
MPTPNPKDWLPILIRKVDRLVHPNRVSIGEFYTAVPSLGTKIPNIVYQTWKEPRLEAPHARVLKQFRRRNPDFSFEFFDDVRAVEYMETAYAGQPILEVFRYVTIPAARADLWRYCVLYKEGGMYCDIDSVIKVPLRQLLEGNPSEILSFEGGVWKGVLDPGRYADPLIYAAEPALEVRKLLDYPDHTVLNWFLAFEAGHPILKETIDLIVKNFPFFKDRLFESVWLGVIHSTGPLALTQGVWNWLKNSDRKPCQRGIDFNGDGVFKIAADRGRDKVSPYYGAMKGRTLGQ